MKTIVTTHPEYLFILDSFKVLAERFYPWDFEVDIARSKEVKSDQLIRITGNLEDDYFILLEEDFFFVCSTPVELLNQIVKFCKEKSVDRFSLQSKVAYACSNWPETAERVGPYRVYKAPSEACLFSLEASVWKKSFLQAQLEVGQSDQEMENKISGKVRRLSYKIYSLEPIVLHYRDAMRHNKQQVVHLKSDPLRLVVQPGDESALYPQGEGHLTELLLK